MQPFKLLIEYKNDTENEAVIHRHLKSYNVSRVGDYNLNPIVITLTDDENEVIAGVTGTMSSNAKYLFISMLWVNEKFRGQDLGSSLLCQIEEEAINCASRSPIRNSK